MRYSKQRDSILKVVQSNCNHPTADEIYQLVKKEIPDISLGTIYRNLNTLVENGLITTFIGSDGKEHFDKTLEHHFHVTCKKCHQIYDIKVDYDFKKELSKKNFQLLKINLMLEGICQQCQEGKKV